MTSDSTASTIAPVPRQLNEPSPRRLKILLVRAGHDDRDIWVGTDPALSKLTHWTSRPVHQTGSMKRALEAFAMPDFNDYDLVISAEYYIALGINLRLRLSGSRTRHIVWGLNQSRKILDSGLPRVIADWAFARSDAIVVHSRREIDIFAAVHSLRVEKFRFCPWGFDLPPRITSRFAGRSVPYVCMVGRNNRDWATFSDGVVAAGVHGVAIGSGFTEHERSKLQSAGIECFEDLDFDECLDCIRHATISAVLINDDDRGAGHITMVAAMHLGIPQIVTRAGVTADYFEEGTQGLGVDFREAGQVSEALTLLFNSPELRRAISDKTRQVAMDRHSMRAVALQARDLIVLKIASPLGVDQSGTTSIQSRDHTQDSRHSESEMT